MLPSPAMADKAVVLWRQRRQSHREGGRSRDTRHKGRVFIRSSTAAVIPVPQGGQTVPPTNVFRKRLKGTARSCGTDGEHPPVR